MPGSSRNSPSALPCPWPAQHGHPCPGEPHGGWQEGHRGDPTHSAVTHSCSQHWAELPWECLLAVPFPPSQVALAGLSPWHWLCSGLLCCVWSPDPALPSRATTTAGFLLCLSTHMNLKFLHSQGSVNLEVAPPKATIAGQGCGLITTFEKHPSVPTPKSFSTQISLPASSHQLLQMFLWQL